VEELLAAQGCSDETAISEAAPDRRWSLQPPCRCDVRSLRRWMEDIACLAEQLEEEVLLHVRLWKLRLDDEGALDIDLQPILVAIPASPLTLLQLSTKGFLDDSLELLRDTNDLRQKWQICGGMALSSAYPHKEPVPWHCRAAAMEVIRALGHASSLGSQQAGVLVVRVPMLDAITHAMADLRAWRHRSSEEAKMLQEERRTKTRDHLRSSIEKERQRLAQTGFDAATDYAPAPVHLEKRVSLKNYRMAERLANYYAREAERSEVTWAGLHDRQRGVGGFNTALLAATPLPIY